MNDRDKQLIIKMLLGGAAIGGGVGVLQSGANYVKYLNDRASQKNKTTNDDDTLYLTVPAAKQASLGLGLGLAGGAVSLLAANALARSLYQKLIKRPEMQAELDAAQRRHLQTLEQSVEQKQAAAGKPVSGMEMLTSTPISLSLLVALASGALTYNALNKTFPGVHKPVNPLPKRVKIHREPGSDPEAARIAQDVAQDELQEPVEEKLASWSANDESAAWDYLTRSMMLTKNASNSDMVDWVYAVAGGRLDELEDTFGQLGFYAACDMVKGASETQVTDRALDLATMYLTKSALLGPCFQFLVAAEVADNMPSFVKIASGLEPEDSNALIGFLATEGAFNRASCLVPWVMSLPESKEASAKQPTRRQRMRQMLQKEIDEDSKSDCRNVKDRLNNSQNLSATAPERGSGRAEGGMTKEKEEHVDIPELVMGIK